MPARRHRKTKPRRKTQPRIGRRRRANQTSGALTNVKHYARITEAVNFTPMAPNQDYNYAFRLALFDRATAVSKNFKYYRAKRVVWTYLPDFNTFQSGGAITLPQVSMLMNRTGDTTLWTPAEYDAQGAVPKQFNKKIRIAYNPNICQSIQYIAQPTGIPAPFLGNIGTRPVYNEWIATGTYSTDNPAPPFLSPSTANHNNEMLYQGHSMLFEVTVPGTVTSLGSVFCEVEWEFKDPLFVSSPTSTTRLAALAEPLISGATE